MNELPAEHAPALVKLTVLLDLVLALLVLLVIPACTYYVLEKTGRKRENYLGARIPTMFGISIAAGSLVVLGAGISLAPQERGIIRLWIIVIAAFGALGLLDDLFGDRAIKGLKGHFSALFTKRRVTTGLIKAVGGVLVGTYIGTQAYAGSPLHVAAAALIIALCANGINLLDLRPGRACGIFLVLAAALLMAALMTPTAPIGELALGAVVIAALPAWLLDSRAKVMVGDVGSNLLGAALGLAIVEQGLIAVQAIALLLLVALHIAAERGSLSATIAGNKTLSAVDRQLGKRH